MGKVDYEIELEIYQGDGCDKMITSKLLDWIKEAYDE